MKYIPIIILVSCFLVLPPQTQASSETIDYIIITTSEFSSAQCLQTFVNWYETYDWLNVNVIDVSTIYSNSLYSDTGPYGDRNLDNPYRDTTDPDPNIMSSTMFNDNPAKIRNYLRYMNNEHNTKYCLIIGDYNDIPSRMVFARGCGAPACPEDCHGTNPYYTLLPTDMYYACLDKCWNQDLDNNDATAHSGFGEGDTYNDNQLDEIDWGYEIAVGRFPVDTETDLQNIISKTLKYLNLRGDEPELYDIILSGTYGHSTWGAEWCVEYSKMLIGDPEQWWNEEMTIGFDDDIYNPYYFDPNPNRPIGEDFTIALVSSRINSGVHAMAHNGHGTTHSWYLGSSNPNNFENANVDALTNEFPMILFSSVPCQCAQFDTVDDSFLEHWVNGKYGACSAIGNTRYGWGSLIYDGLNSSSQYLLNKMIDSYFKNEHTRMGDLLFEGKKDAELWYTEKYDGAIRWATMEQILFGDPAMELKFPKEVYGGEKHQLKLTLVTEDGEISPRKSITLDGVTRKTNDEGVVYFYLISGDYSLYGETITLSGDLSQTITIKEPVMPDFTFTIFIIGISVLFLCVMLRKKVN